jgi:hypothetical protein
MLKGKYICKVLNDNDKSSIYLGNININYNDISNILIDILLKTYDSYKYFEYRGQQQLITLQEELEYCYSHDIFYRIFSFEELYNVFYLRFYFNLYDEDNNKWLFDTYNNISYNNENEIIDIQDSTYYMNDEQYFNYLKDLEKIFCELCNKKYPDKNNQEILIILQKDIFEQASINYIEKHYSELFNNF